jgi:hypothetical protein
MTARPPNVPIESVATARLRLLTDLAERVGRTAAENSLLEISTLLRGAPRRTIKAHIRQTRQGVGEAVKLPVRGVGVVDPRLERTLSAAARRAFDAHFAALVSNIRRKAA